jgi:hypothetical protein
LRTLPTELKIEIMESLDDEDVTNLRLVSRNFTSAASSLYSKYVARDFPWCWELHLSQAIQQAVLKEQALLNPDYESDEGTSNLENNFRPPFKQLTIDWYRAYQHTKILHRIDPGLKSRARIWGDLEVVVDYIDKLEPERWCQPSIPLFEEDLLRFPVDYWYVHHHGPRTCGGHSDREGDRVLNTWLNDNSAPPPDPEIESRYGQEATYDAYNPSTIRWGWVGCPDATASEHQGISSLLADTEAAALSASPDETSGRLSGDYVEGTEVAQDDHGILTLVVNATQFEQLPQSPDQDSDLWRYKCTGSPLSYGSFNLLLKSAREYEYEDPLLEGANTRFRIETPLNSSPLPQPS